VKTPQSATWPPFSMPSAPGRRSSVGLSLGGYMSLAFYRAASGSHQRAAIIDTGPGFKKDDASRDVEQPRSATPGARYDKEGLAVLKSGSGRRRAYAVHRVRRRPRQCRARHAGAEEFGCDRNRCRTSRVPSIVIVGSNDTPFLAASDYMAAKIPGCKKAVIPNPAHAANIDPPAGVQ